MKRSINLWQFVGFAVVALGGTLLHFLYEWTGKSVWVAAFSGINESTWEHMKLLFVPLVIFALVESFFFKDRPDFWCVKAKGTVLGLVLIPVLFYTYNGVIGMSPDWINIAIFFISAAAVFIFETRLFHREGSGACHKTAAIAVFVIIAIAFVLFTFVTPNINIFRDPLTGTYGLS
jgi:hypothetical protein